MKNKIASWVLMECYASIHNVEEKLHFFERKYKQSWDRFEQEVTQSATEDCSKWDDYIEWKAYIKKTEELHSKVEEIKHGNFQVA